MNTRILLLEPRCNFAEFGFSHDWVTLDSTNIGSYRMCGTRQGISRALSIAMKILLDSEIPDSVLKPISKFVIVVPRKVKNARACRVVMGRFVKKTSERIKSDASSTRSSIITSFIGYFVTANSTVSHIASNQTDCQSLSNTILV